MGKENMKIFLFSILIYINVLSLKSLKNKVIFGSEAVGGALLSFIPIYKITSIKEKINIQH